MTDAIKATSLTTNDISYIKNTLAVSEVDPEKFEKILSQIQSAAEQLESAYQSDRDFFPVHDFTKLATDKILNDSPISPDSSVDSSNSLVDNSPSSKEESKVQENPVPSVSSTNDNKNSDVIKSITKTSSTPVVASIQEQNQFPLLSKVTNTKYDSVISEMSKKYNVPTNLVKSVIYAESTYNPKATSRTGAMGLMQLMPATAQWLGVKDAYDPKQNIEGGTKYLGYLLDKYNNNLKLSVAAYNAGPGNVNKYKGIPPFTETQNYVKKILG